MEHTLEEKKEYYRKLRQAWTEAKQTIDTEGVKGLIKTYGLSVSPMSFWLVACQMRSQGLDGLPYIDAKTFQGWKSNGFIVKKGEKSKLKGVTWINVNEEKEINEPDGDFKKWLMPKEYHLFHKSQVEAIV